MKIERMIVKNFEGIRAMDLALGDINLVYGPNGAGKSSIADALEFALTGAALRGGTLPDLIRQGAKKLEVEGRLTNGHEIRRERTRSGGEVCLDGLEVKAAEAEAAI